MKSMFFFDSMLTPKIITFVYWFLLFIAVMSGISIMFSGYGFSFGNFFTGLIAIAAGALGARIWCELMIVLFKINENLQKMASRSNTEVPGA